MMDGVELPPHFQCTFFAPYLLQMTVKQRVPPHSFWQCSNGSNLPSDQGAMKEAAKDKFGMSAPLPDLTQYYMYTKW